jgi:hypothetical protein
MVGLDTVLFCTDAACADIGVISAMANIADSIFLFIE